jgi:hypothetical protein
VEFAPGIAAWGPGGGDRRAQGDRLARHPADLLRCELAAVGYRQTAFYDLQENTYLAVFEPAAAPASPTAIRPCSVRRG